MSPLTRRASWSCRSNVHLRESRLDRPKYAVVSGGMSDTEVRDKIWAGDLLYRRHEADTIEKYLVREMQAFCRLGRSQSIVLAIDSPYGRGKSWFVERLAKQLELSHPVARIDAWADDAGDEPLTAFMAAIDEALAPYLSTSKKLRGRLAAVKASALPVMGKLVSGALVKALSKIAGDEIEDQLGTAIEDAVRHAKDDEPEEEDGAAAQAMEAAFEKLGSEIDSLVDRRGAAMLAAYRQRKQSRVSFRNNMRELVAIIDSKDGAMRTPLMVVVDELDRCRPDYAIKVLEEIKHFFDIPGISFILALHGGQLSKSVKAIYGSEFDSEEYLRRFFTRRYELRSHPIVEMAAAVFNQWGMDENRFEFPAPTVADNYMLNKPRTIGLILSELKVTPREIFAIMDGLRLFMDGWDHPDPIEPMALLSLLVQVVRGQQLNFVQSDEVGHIRFKGIAIGPDGEGRAENFSIIEYLAALNPLAWRPLSEVGRESGGANAARNYLVGLLQNEWQARYSRSPTSPPHQSHLSDYIPRIADLARFIEKPEAESRPSS